MFIEAYHGTCDIIKQFNITDYMGKNTCNNGGAIYFTTSKEVAMQYSIEAYKRQHEWDEGINEDDLQEQAEKQAHYYRCLIEINNPLYIDGNMYYNKEFYKLRGIKAIDSYLVNYIINILQGRRYQQNMEDFDEHKDYEAIDFLLPYIEEYDDELDEYIEKKFNPDVIICKDTIDSINEESNYMSSDILAVLDKNNIKIIEEIHL